MNGSKLVRVGEVIILFTVALVLAELPGHLYSKGWDGISAAAGLRR